MKNKSFFAGPALLALLLLNGMARLARSDESGVPELLQME